MSKFTVGNGGFMVASDVPSQLEADAAMKFLKSVHKEPYHAPDGKYRCNHCKKTGRTARGLANKVCKNG